MPLGKRKRIGFQPFRYAKRKTRRLTPMRPKRISRSKILRAPRTHSFCRYGETTAHVLAAGATELDVGMHFTFDQISNYTEFTSLFDRYKITAVKLRLHMVTNPDASTQLNLTTPANASNFFPGVWYCADSDDANPQTIATIKERGDVKFKLLRPNSFITFTVRPNILSLTYRTGVTSGYSPHKGYVDCGNVDVPHYAFKFTIDPQGNTPTGSFYFRLERKFYFTMRDVR